VKKKGSLKVGGLSWKIVLVVVAGWRKRGNWQAHSYKKDVSREKKIRHCVWGHACGNRQISPKVILLLKT